MSDLDFQLISTVHSAAMPKPATIASTTAGIAPTTFVSIVSGTAAIATITPPVAGAHMLCIIFSSTQSGQFPTTGNITASATTAASNVPQLLVFDPGQNKYFVKMN